MSMKTSKDIIGNRTRYIPACSAVPQPTATRQYMLVARIISFVHCWMWLWAQGQRWIGHVTEHTLNESEATFKHKSYGSLLTGLSRLIKLVGWLRDGFTMDPARLSSQPFLVLEVGSQWHRVKNKNAWNSVSTPIVSLNGREHRYSDRFISYIYIYIYIYI